MHPRICTSPSRLRHRSLGSAQTKPGTKFALWVLWARSEAKVSENSSTCRRQPLQYRKDSRHVYMADAPRVLYDSLSTFDDLQQLIDAGESEGLHLECKAPAEPRLNKELRAKLAEATSGFANTAGGIIIWGAATTRQAQSGLDVITAIQPLGSVTSFARQIERALPGLTTPATTASETKVIRDPTAQSRGVVVTLIPQTLGDPLQSNVDERFHFRNGDEFTTLPYVMIQRLFAATESPNLRPVFIAPIVKLEANGMWRLPIVMENTSSAVAERVVVVVEISNPTACSSVTAQNLSDISEINPGKRMFRGRVDDEGIHRGLNQVIGSLLVKMHIAKRAKRTLRLKFSVYANHMRACSFTFAVTLAKRRFSVRQTGQGFLY